ncbi:MAG: YceI family protein [Candidatus Omnitrophica bacterium]|nr:YceI family protein [Candidatus Omnitrophota bacterium]
MRKIVAGILLSVAVTLTGGASFAATQFALDKVHSSVNFAIAHLVVSKVTGGFDDIDAAVAFDANDLEHSSINATIQVASINTKNKQRDDHLRSPDFFEVEKFPTINFTSKKIVMKDAMTYLITGDLTMKGVTHEIEVPVMIMGPIINPMNQQPILGLEAHFKINRQDYGVKWNKTLDNGGLMLGNDVDVDIAFAVNKIVQK